MGRQEGVRAWGRKITTGLLILVVFCCTGDNAYAQDQREAGGHPLRGGMVAPWDDVLLPLEFDNRPFERNMGKLPPFYAGYDPVLLYTRVKGSKESVIRPRPGPGDESRRRTGKLLIPLPPSGDADLGGIYAFRVIPADRHYNADKQTLDIFCELSAVLNDGRQDESRRSFAVKYQPWVDNKYTSTDSRGKKVEIEELKFREYGIAFSNFNALSVETLVLPKVRKTLDQQPKKKDAMYYPDEDFARETIVGRIRLTPKEAGRLKAGIMALAVCRLIDPYVTSDTVHEKQVSGKYKEYFGQYYYLNARLLELWFYHSESGKVLMKIKIPETLRSP
jgi:hypothetical protein